MYQLTTETQRTQKFLYLLFNRETAIEQKKLIKIPHDSFGSVHHSSLQQDGCQELLVMGLHPQMQTGQGF